jgi:hypothetical protein
MKVAGFYTGLVSSLDEIEVGEDPRVFVEVRIASRRIDGQL